MRNHLNGLQRIAVVLSVAWTAFIFAAAAIDAFGGSSFDSELTGKCPSLTSKNFVEWRDARSGKKITIFHEGEHSLSCNDAAARAASLMIDEQSGAIEPRRSVSFFAIAAAVLAPPMLLWFSGYLIVWISNWVLAGFRHNKDL